MKSYLEVLAEIKMENEKYFKNYKRYARTIKKIAEKEVGKVRVFIFGSVVKGKHTPASDVDVLIVAKNIPESMSERAGIKTKILKEVGFFSPFELHLVNEKEAEWYGKFIDKKISV